MEFEVRCKCGSTLTVKEEDVFEKITCRYCGQTYLLNELDSELYDVCYRNRINDFDISHQTLRGYSGIGGKILIPTDVETVADRVFLRNGTVEGVICSEGLKHIGNSSFANCLALKNVAMNQGLESIGKNAFCSCGSLTKINIPASVSLIDEEAFMGCRGVVSLDFDENCKAVIGKSAFEGLEKLKELEIYDGMTVEDHAFSDCTNLEKLIVNGEVCLKDNVFTNCKRLTVYLTAKKGLLTPKWFNPKAFNSNVKINWNYHK